MDVGNLSQEAIIIIGHLHPVSKEGKDNFQLLKERKSTKHTDIIMLSNYKLFP